MYDVSGYYVFSIVLFVTKLQLKFDLPLPMNVPWFSAGRVFQIYLVSWIARSKNRTFVWCSRWQVFHLNVAARQSAAAFYTFRIDNVTMQLFQIVQNSRNDQKHSDVHKLGRTSLERAQTDLSEPYGFELGAHAQRKRINCTQHKSFLLFSKGCTLYGVRMS